MRNDIEGCAIATYGRAIDPRQSPADREVVDQIARLEIIRAIQHQLGRIQQFSDVGRRQISHLGFHRNICVDCGEPALRGNGFGQTLQRVPFVKQHLPLQIAGFDIITIDDAQAPHACPHQQRSHHRAGRTATHYRNPSTAQPRLSGLANRRK